MEHRISTLFYIRTSKKKSDGLAPIYLRITVNGQRLEQSVQRFVDPAQWCRAAGRLKGNTSQARRQHNDQMAALIRVGKDYCPATLGFPVHRSFVRFFQRLDL